MGLGHVYESVPFTRTLRDMIEEGYLVPLRGYLLRGGANLEGVRVRTEDGDREFDPQALARTINTPERNRLVVDGTRHEQTFTLPIDLRVQAPRAGACPNP